MLKGTRLPPGRGEAGNSMGAQPSKGIVTLSRHRTNGRCLVSSHSINGHEFTSLLETASLSSPISIIPKDRRRPCDSIVSEENVRALNS
jgi:hypothetical protein